MRKKFKDNEVVNGLIKIFIRTYNYKFDEDTFIRILNNELRSTGYKHNKRGRYYVINYSKKFSDLFNYGACLIKQEVKCKAILIANKEKLNKKIMKLCSKKHLWLVNDWDKSQMKIY